MHVTFNNDGTVKFEDARLVFTNFAGVGDMYNREGDRHFTIVIPEEEIAEALVAEGWNVKVRPPRNEGDEPFMTMKVKLKFQDWGPAVYLVTGNKMHKLDANSAKRLDKIRIAKAEVYISPYEWNMANGKSGRTAYLKSIKVWQRVDDPFAEEYERMKSDYMEDDDNPDRLPF